MVDERAHPRELLHGEAPGQIPQVLVRLRALENEQDRVLADEGVVVREPARGEVERRAGGEQLLELLALPGANRSDYDDLVVHDALLLVAQSLGDGTCDRLRNGADTVAGNPHCTVW